MSDVADAAAVLEAEHLSRSLARISPVIPEGVAGECEECGEPMKRLVGGRCGFCRDGRRPPADRYPDPAMIAAPVHQQEEKTVPNVTGTRSITIAASGELLAAIERIAAEQDIALGRVAKDLADAGLAGLTAALRASGAAPRAEATEPSIVDVAEGEAWVAINRRAMERDCTATAAAVSLIEDWLGERYSAAERTVEGLAAASIEDLIGELQERLERGSPAATARIAALETQLEEVEGRLGRARALLDGAQ